MIPVRVRAHPGARAQTVVLLPDGALDVRVRAPALGGRANEAVLSALAEAVGLRPHQVRLRPGERSREKLVEIDLDSPDELRRRLAVRGR